MKKSNNKQKIKEVISVDEEINRCKNRIKTHNSRKKISEDFFLEFISQKENDVKNFDVD